MTHTQANVVGGPASLRVYYLADTYAAHSRPVTTRVGGSISPASRYTSGRYGLQLSLRHAFASGLVCHTMFSHGNTSTLDIFPINSWDWKPCALGVESGERVR